MKIKMVKTVANAAGVLRAGREYDVGAKDSQSLIDAGAAVALEAAKKRQRPQRKKAEAPGPENTAEAQQ